MVIYSIIFEEPQRVSQKCCERVLTKFLGNNFLGASTTKRFFDKRVNTHRGRNALPPKKNERGAYIKDDGGGIRGLNLSKSGSTAQDLPEMARQLVDMVREAAKR